MTMEDVGGIIQFWLIADSFNDQLHAVDKKGKSTLDAAHAKGDATGMLDFGLILTVSPTFPGGIPPHTCRVTMSFLVIMSVSC